MQRAVHVQSVVAQFALSARICYLVNLSCGCSYWEYRPIGMAPPRRGRSATCCAGHGSGTDPDACKIGAFGLDRES